MLWLTLIAGALALVAVALVAANLYGARRWEAGTRDLRARLDAARQSVRPAHFDARELEGLPPPVQRYFRAVLKDGAPMIAVVRMSHAGTINMSESGEQWKDFTSTQTVVTQRPGFDWDGRIALFPGFPVRVHDAYVAGEGILHATLMGLVTLAEVRGTPEGAQGELMRYLAEARGRTVQGKIVPTPWQGRWRNYEMREGMRVPTEGEAAWLLPSGAKLYWRGRAIGLDYAAAEETAARRASRPSFIS
jgi:hypothetical protein